MGEARRRSQEGLPPKQKKSKSNQDSSSRSFSWTPITEKQRIQFYDLTVRGGWIGIGVVVLVWLIVRIIGPAAGWWVPADIR